MKRKEIPAGGVDILGRPNRVTLIGTAAQLEKGERAIASLSLTGDEGEDRLVIQGILDLCPGMPRVLYNGNTVYPKKKLVQELSAMRRKRVLCTKRSSSGGRAHMEMPGRAYEFLSQNVDYAHYDRHGYVVDYSDSYALMLEGIRRDVLRYRGAGVISRFTDVRAILEESGLMADAEGGARRSAGA